MINVIIWSNRHVEIENKEYSLENQLDMVEFMKELLDKVHYSGETICLESASFDESKGLASYTEIERWK